MRPLTRGHSDCRLQCSRQTTSTPGSWTRVAPLRFKIQIGVHGGAPPKGVCRRSLPTTFVALTPPLPTPPNSPPLPSFTPAPTAVAATVTRPPPPAGPGLAWPRPPAGAASGVGSVTHDTPPPPTTPPRPPPPPLSPRRHARAPTIAVGDAQTSATGASGGWRCIACSFFPDWRSPRSAPTAHPSPLTRAFLSPASYSWFL